MNRNRADAAQGLEPDPVLGSLVTFGTDKARWEPPSRPLDDRAWRKLLDQARPQRLVLLLGAAVDNGWPVTDEQRLQVTDECRMLARQALVLDRELVKLGKVLDDAEVPFVVLKGMATSRLIYRDPGWRQCGDIDVWVPERHHERALEVLGEAGYRPLQRPLFGPTWELLRPARPLASPGGVEVDIHRIVRGPLPSQQLPEVALGEVRQFRLGGRFFRAMDDAGLLLHSCLHMAGPGTRLSTLADLVRLHHSELRFDEALAGEISAATAATVDWALGEARRWAHLPPALFEQQILAVTTSRARWRQRYIQASPRVVPLLAITEMDGIRNKGSALFEIVHPSSEFLRFKGRTRSSQVQRLVRTVSAIVARGGSSIKSRHSPSRAP